MMDKPENFVQFIVQNICGGVCLQQKNEKMKRTQEETRKQLKEYVPQKMADANTTSEEDWKYHCFAGTSLKQPDIEWHNVSALTNPDPENNHINKCQVNCFRSLEGHPFFLKMDGNKFVEVMEMIRRYARETEQEESFYDLETIDVQKRKIIDESVTLGQHDYSFDAETDGVPLLIISI